MCRLFGLHAGNTPIKATFWLLDAPNSLSLQSRCEPDGTGIGVFRPDGSPEVLKQPIAAWDDRDFALEARGLESMTFLAHVRYATTGTHTMVNTHPFEQDGRLFAHNGAFEQLEKLDARLAELGAGELVQGQTDSERLFALITAETRLAAGDVAAGIASALRWTAETLPVYSLNLVITTATELWAVRYPETHELYVLERRPEDQKGRRHIEARSPRINARSQDPVATPYVIVATERMDTSPGWRRMEPGELLHVDSSLNTISSLPFPPQLSHPLALADLDPATAAAQHPHVQPGQARRTAMPGES
ncbi:class II glutamine amidotransferase [Pseudarthrobacter sp. N5]|uniref:class II glutamine amidotransferase n=1 Tax=Pseudarthrobacter sp. N5 TaxID=3418416 RepID=UPI003CF78275